jgi:hypothetical protein
MRRKIIHYTFINNNFFLKLKLLYRKLREKVSRLLTTVTLKEYRPTLRTLGFYTGKV